MAIVKRFLVLIWAFLGCQEQEKRDSKLKPEDSSSTSSDVLFSATDSIEYIYYPDPQKQRVYKNIIIRDTVLINALTGNLQRPAVSAKECTHNSKFYLFRKGDVYKTVYVSDSCQYLAYSVNGKQVFISTRTEFREMLDQLKKTIVD